jgi:hypothetical protein
MRRIGTHTVALSAVSARPNYRSSDCGCVCALSGGFLSQTKQPGSGWRKPD